MAKRWCFTSYEDDFIYGESSMLFLIYGREICPTTNRKHLQGFVCMKSQCRLPAMKKMDASAHFEIARGSVQENIVYCSKDGDVVCFGEAPNEPFIHGGQATKKKYARARDLAEKGKFNEIDSQIFVSHYSNLKKIRQDIVLAQPISDLVENSICGLWLCGPSGVGKSYFAREFAKSNNVRLFNKNLNKWWDGYNGEEIVLLEDIDQFSMKHMGYFLKIWCDEYVFNAEIKCGMIKVRPRCIIVTSNYTIDELWGLDLSLKLAISRRFSCPFISCRDDLALCSSFIIPVCKDPALVYNSEHADDIAIIDFDVSMFE